MRDAERDVLIDCLVDPLTHRWCGAFFHTPSSSLQQMRGLPHDQVQSPFHFHAQEFSLFSQRYPSTAFCRL